MGQTPGIVQLVLVLITFVQLCVTENLYQQKYLNFIKIELVVTRISVFLYYY